MKPTPPGWPRISSALYYEDPFAALDWLCNAFGFEVVIKVVDEGKLAHSELRFGDGLVMVGDAAKSDGYRASPRSLDGRNTQNMFIYVDDIDAHCARARSAGARIINEPTVADYGPDHFSDKGYECVDPEGHHWWFAQRLRNPPTK